MLGSSEIRMEGVIGGGEIDGAIGEREGMAFGEVHALTKIWN